MSSPTSGPPDRLRRRPHPSVLVAAAVTAAAVGAVLLLGGGTPPPPAPPTAESSEVAAPPPRSEPQPRTAPATSPPPPPGPPSSTAATVPAAPTATADGADQRWRETTTGFATAFTADPGPGQDWAAGLMPWVSADLAAAYQSTDPTRLPTGELLKVEATSESSDLVVATVSYDTGLQLAIELRPAPDTEPGWVVSTVLALPG